MKHGERRTEEENARLFARVFFAVMLELVLAAGVMFLFALRALSLGHVGGFVWMLISTAFTAVLAAVAISRYLLWTTRLARVRHELATQPRLALTPGGRHRAEADRAGDLA